MSAGRLCRFFTFLLFVFPPFKILFTQQTVPLHFEALTINNGLSQGLVTCITQDKKGFMWFATGDGLNKYDGYNFTVYHHDPLDTTSLGDDDITYVYEDSHERMWICTRNNGIDLFDRENLQFIHIKHSGVNSLWSNNTYNITEDRNGILWIRTLKGIDRLTISEKEPVASARNDFYSSHTLRFNHINLPSTVSSFEKTGYPPKLFISSSGNKFVYTYNALFQIYFNGDGQKYSLINRLRFPSIKNYEVADILEDTIRHTFLMHNSNSVYEFRDDKFNDPRVIYTPVEYNDKWRLDKKGLLWMSENWGITRVNTASGKYERIVSDNAELSHFVKEKNYFFTDKTGVLWIGTAGFGILKYNPAKERFHTILPSQYFYKLFETNTGKINCKGFFNLSIDNNDAITMDTLLKEKAVKRYSVNYPSVGFACQDRTGSFWYALDKALIEYNPSTKKMHPYALPSYLKKSALCIICDRNNNLWMSADMYLVKFNTSSNSFSKYAYPFKTVGNDLVQVISEDEDKDGSFWLGTTKGLLLFNSRNASWKYWYHKELDSTTISNNSVFSFCKDAADPLRYLWTGTKGGLNRLDKTTGKFISFTTKNGLPNNVIYGILADQHNNLWLSTNRGLCEFNPVTKSIRNFDVDDGLQGNEFNRYAYCKTKDDILVFGGMNGINYFNPDDISPLNPPEVVLTDFRLFNKPANFKGPHSPLTKDISFTKELSLQYEQNMVTLQFAAMDYQKTKSVRYRYKMKGFDKDWIYSGTTHEATYTNLDPDTYYFIVEGSNSDGVWGREQISLTIHIIPAWWQTWWFYLLAAVAAASLFYAVYRYRINQLLKMQQVRNGIARDLHDEIGSSLSTISIYSKVAQHQLDGAAGNATSMLTKISETANKVQDAMSDIVWSINTNNDGLENLINRMREHAIQLSEAKNYTLHFALDETLHPVRLNMEKRKDFYLIYKEALNNIVKYAQAENIWVNVTTNESKIFLRVKDDGKGFDINEKSRSGNGLQNMKSRAAALKGTIQIVSEKGNGTSVYLSLPR